MTNIAVQLLENLDLVFIVIIILSLSLKIFSTAHLFWKSGFVFKNEIKKKPTIVSVSISVLAVFIFIYGMFLPWYDVDLTLDGKTTDLITLDGSGVSVSSPLGGSQKFPANINLILFLAVFYSILDIFGMKSGRKYSFKILRNGFFTLLIFVLAYVFVLYLPQEVDLIANYYNLKVPDFIQNILKTVSSSPIKGESIQATPLGEVKLFWSAGFGLYMFFLACILKIISGIIGIVSSKSTTAP